MKKTLLFFVSLISVCGYSQLATEGFEGTWPPTGWAVYNVSGPEFTWQQMENSPLYAPFQGTKEAFLNREDVDSGATEDWLVTSMITVPVNGKVRFYSRLTIPGNQNTTYKVMISSNPDQSNLDAYALLQQFTEAQLNPAQGEYMEKTVSIPASYVGQQVYVAFVMMGDLGDRWLLDNVTIASECLAPSNMAAMNITATSATLAWTDTGFASAWEVEVLPATNAQTGVGVAVASVPYTVTGLTAGGSYKYYLRSLCGGMNSIWVGPFYFNTTSCSPADQCNYSFILTDTGNDGWNGNTMTLSQGGLNMEISLMAGGTTTTNVPLCDNIPFQLYWNNGGSNPEEVGIIISNSFGQYIFTKVPGEGEQNTVLFTGVAECESIDCFPTFNLSADLSGTTATLGWGGPAAGEWEYYIVPAGSPAPLNTTTGIPTSTNPVIVENLSQNTSYEFYVKIICDEENSSPWSAPFAFEVGTSNSVSGTVMIDANNDAACNTLDYAWPSMEIVATVNGGSPFSVYTNASGEYVIYNLPDGPGSVTLTPVSPNGFPAIAPVTQAVNFTPGNIDDTISFCVAMPEDPINDLEITLIPLDVARPGFMSTYKLTVINNGPTPQSNVTATVLFNNNRMELYSSDNPSYTVSGNTINVDLGTIGSFGTSNTQFIFSVYPPMVNIGGEVLVFNSSVAMTEADDVPANNTSIMNQVMVNSFDPNDITVHEGPFIYEAQTADYLTYTMRFQNTGTADAVNIKLENVLDEKLDWATFMPISSSHDYFVTRNGNVLEFMYPNIHLPDSTANEAGSHGYVSYKVKPKATFGLGDIVFNTANIFFDFNPAIVTNTATTEVISAMGISKNEISNVTMHPNPVNDLLHLDIRQGNLLSVEVYDVNGRLCISANESIVNMESLSAGLYFVKVTTDIGSSTHKVIKK